MSSQSVQQAPGRGAARHPRRRPADAGAHPVDAVLLLYHRPILRGYKDASTVTEHIGAFAQHSRFPVWAVNTARGPRPGLRKLRFQAIVMHYSMFGSGVYRLDDELLEYLDRTDAYKIAFFQDEYYHCGKRFRFLDDHAVDCVFTCLTESEFGKVYGAYTQVPKLVSTLPGYVSDETIRAARRFSRPDAQRHIDVGYRGRPLPPNLGRGAQEKTEIALRFAELAGDTGLRLDLDIEETGRLYGDAWYEFMADCRCMLGVESGVSAYDLDGRLYAEYQRRLATNPLLTVEDLADALAPCEDTVYYRTISPRHFESAAFRVTQVLFEGSYSGLMEPMRHYIPLSKDFANFDEVVVRIKDPDVRAEVAENTHRDLIASGEFSYARMIEVVDATLADAGLKAQPLDGGDAELVRDALREGGGRRQVLLFREDPPVRLRALSAHLYHRTPAPVLRALRRGLDHLQTMRAPDTETGSRA
jgi:hypothetical protein